MAFSLRVTHFLPNLTGSIHTLRTSEMLVSGRILIMGFMGELSERKSQFKSTYIDVIINVAEKIDRCIQFDELRFLQAIFQSNGPIEVVEVGRLQ